MNSIIETERLLLREFCQTDASGLFELNSDPEVVRHTGDLPFSSISDAGDFIKAYNDYKKNGFGRWAVVVKDSDKFVGWCGLKLNEEAFVDIGFRFFQNEWGKGYATESALACLNYGFKHLNMDEIIGRASFENKASIRVLEKLGMTFWKTDDCKGIENSVYYKLTKTHYHSFGKFDDK